MPTQLRLWEKAASQGDKGDNDVSSEGEGSGHRDRGLEAVSGELMRTGCWLWGWEEDAGFGIHIATSVFPVMHHIQPVNTCQEIFL